MHVVHLGGGISFGFVDDRLILSEPTIYTQKPQTSNPLGDEIWDHVGDLFSSLSDWELASLLYHEMDTAYNSVTGRTHVVKCVLKRSITGVVRQFCAYSVVQYRVFGEVWTPTGVRYDTGSMF